MEDFIERDLARNIVEGQVLDDADVGFFAGGGCSGTKDDLKPGEARALLKGASAHGGGWK